MLGEMVLFWDWDEALNTFDPRTKEVVQHPTWVARQAGFDFASGANFDGSFVYCRDGLNQ